MRQPIQVLVLPYKHENKKIKYAIFRREDLDVWQGIAGGVEEGETYLEAGRREANEEASIPLDREYILLDSKSTIPVNFIQGNFLWGKDVYNAIEYCFGVCVDDVELIISDEHQEYKWVDYEEAFKLFKWDSNRNALWELNERIKRME
jgi:dATP pyrophosphohydrolase